MKTYIQNGHVITVSAPAGGIASGNGLIVGSIFGITAYSAAEGDPVELSTTGVFQLPKASAAVLSVGTRVSWDDTAKQVNIPAAGASPSASQWRRPGTASPPWQCGWIAWRPRRRKASPGTEFLEQIEAHR
jgi:predicted RecA/RadA family phage recombinase